MRFEYTAFDPLSDPLRGLVEDTEAIARFVESNLLLSNIGFAWERYATSDMRMRILLHLCEQSNLCYLTPRFLPLRLIRLAGLRSFELLALYKVDDFDVQMPRVFKNYLALYFDLDRGIFSTGSFFGQYVESQLSSSPRPVLPMSELQRRGHSLAAALLGYHAKLEGALSTEAAE